MVEFLLSLLQGGELEIMQLLGEGNGAHGLKQDGHVEVWAVDIAGYCGTKVRVEPAPACIEVVAKLIENFPPGHFDIGYPRPTKEDQPVKPHLDVFFAVDTQEKAWKCWKETGWGGSPGGLNTMLSPAKERIKTAVAGCKATIHSHFADGLNHLHVQVTKPFRRAT